MTTFLSIWVNPRRAIHELHDCQDKFSHLKVVLSIALAYFLGLVAILWLRDLFPNPESLMTPKVLEGLFWSFVLVAATLFTAFNLSTLFLYFLLKAFGGVGTIFQTKTVIHWTGVSTLPTALFIVIFTSSGMSGTANFVLQTISLLLGFGFIAYSLVILFKMLAEIHQLNFWKTLAAVFAGILGSGIVMAFFFSLINFLTS